MTINGLNSTNSKATDDSWGWKPKFLAGATLIGSVCLSALLLRSGRTNEAERLASHGVKVIRQTARVKDIKQQHSGQIAKFTEWANADSWHRFDMSHYDWWAFPITRNSHKYGNRFALSKSEIESLKQDPAFMEGYRQGVNLVARSWGWDINQSTSIFHKYGAQRWTGHNVRLGKMGDSLQLFGQDDLFQSLQKFSRQPHVQPTLEPWVKRILEQAKSLHNHSSGTSQERFFNAKVAKKGEDLSAERRKEYGLTKFIQS